jgi:hypothetical protein
MDLNRIRRQVGRYQDGVTWTNIDEVQRQVIVVKDFLSLTPPRHGFSEGRHALQTIDARQPLAALHHACPD